METIIRYINRFNSFLIKRFMGRNGKLVEYADRELRLAGFLDEDRLYGGLLYDAVIELVRVFSEQGHSGMSAAICVNVFKKVASYEPLTPLTGEDSEWQGTGCNTLQNKRCFHVFKDETGAYDTEGIIFQEKDGTCFTSKDSRVPVEFPYVPTTRICER